MPLTSPLRTLALALGLALAAGAAPSGSWAQEAVTDEPTATTDVESTQEAAPAGDAAGAEEAAGTEAGAEAGTEAGAEAAATDGAATDGAAPAEEGVPLAGGADLPVIGAPIPGGIDFQPASTLVAEDLQWLDGMILVIITVIVLFVTALLAWVAVRYNARRNPTPASFTHNSPLEIAWTIVPIVILVFIGAFSLPVLFEEQEIPEGDIHIKATGYQWFWEYEYPDEGVVFSSYMVGYGQAQMSEAEDDPIRAQLASLGYEPEHYKLAPDTAVVVPVGATVVVTVTGGDVIHSWKVPAFGIMQDAVPGRLAQTWFRAEQEGVFFGQCSELCGKDHAYMPIAVRVVSQEEYDAWLAAAQVEFAA